MPGRLALWRKHSGDDSPLHMSLRIANAGSDAARLSRILLLRPPKGHLDLPFIPTASAIGGQVHAIHPMVMIHDLVVLSNRRRPFRHDSDILSVHFDRAGSTIDLSPQERLGDVQELDDPGLSIRVILP